MEVADAPHALSRVIDGACLPNDRDLDLSWVLQAFLDLLTHVARKPQGAQVLDVLGLNDDAYLTAGLNRERFLDAGKGIGNDLERLQALDVVLQ